MLNTESFSSGQAWDSSHEFLYIGALSSGIPRSSHLTVELLNVFHGPGAIISGDGARLSNGMNMSHVIDGRGRVRVEGLNVSVNVLSTKFC